MWLEESKSLAGSQILDFFLDLYKMGCLMKFTQLLASLDYP